MPQSGLGPPVRRRAQHLESTSSLGPSAWARPSAITSTRSTPASALGRWATTTTMPPRGPHAQDRLGQRLLALAVQVGVRLVQHHQERLAVERAGQPDPLALAGRQHRPALADLGLVALRQAQDQLVHPGRLRGRDDASARRSGSKRAMFWATVPANSSTSCGR